MAVDGFEKILPLILGDEPDEKKRAAYEHSARGFWRDGNCGKLPLPLAFLLTEAAFSVTLPRAVRWMQRVAGGMAQTGTMDDGSAVNIATMFGFEPEAMIDTFTYLRKDYFRQTSITADLDLEDGLANEACVAALALLKAGN